MKKIYIALIFILFISGCSVNNTDKKEALEYLVNTDKETLLKQNDLTLVGKGGISIASQHKIINSLESKDEYNIVIAVQLKSVLNKDLTINTEDFKLIDINGKEYKPNKNLNTTENCFNKTVLPKKGEAIGGLIFSIPKNNNKYLLELKKESLYIYKTIILEEN